MTEQKKESGWIAERLLEIAREGSTSILTPEEQGLRRNFEDLLTMCLHGDPPWKVWLPRISEFVRSYDRIVQELSDLEKVAGEVEYLRGYYDKHLGVIEKLERERDEAHSESTRRNVNTAAMEARLHEKVERLEREKHLAMMALDRDAHSVVADSVEAEEKGIRKEREIPIHIWDHGKEVRFMRGVPSGSEDGEIVAGLADKIRNVERERCAKIADNLLQGEGEWDVGAAIRENK